MLGRFEVKMVMTLLLMGMKIRMNEDGTAAGLS